MLNNTQFISPLILPEELQKLMQTEDLVILDTRAEADYLAGHIPGAISCNRLFTYLVTDNTGGLELMVSTFAEEFSKKGIRNSHSVVIYENALDSGYGQSCRGRFIFNYLGHEKVSVLNGGFTGWVLAGFKVENDPVHLPESHFEVKINPSHIIDKAGVKAALGRDDIILLDCRDKEEWLGLSSSPYGRDFCPRKGRIPGAVWLEWYRLMTAESGLPMFKNKVDILNECKTAGITPEIQVIVYCFKGSRSSNTFLALQQAGIKNVRNYFPSWNEWSRDFSLPIDDRILKE